MYIYKTEILTVSTKWFSDKANAEDISMLDKLINERAAEGWELATYDYIYGNILTDKRCICGYLPKGKGITTR